MGQNLATCPSLKEEIHDGKDFSQHDRRNDRECFHAPLAVLADLPRQQLALMTQSPPRCSSIRKRAQGAAASGCIAPRHNTRKWPSGCATLRLQRIDGVQTELLRFNLQEAAQYWQQIATAAFKAQADLVGTAGPGARRGQRRTDARCPAEGVRGFLDGSASGTTPPH